MNVTKKTSHSITAKFSQMSRLVQNSFIRVLKKSKIYVFGKMQDAWQKVVKILYLEAMRLSRNVISCKSQARAAMLVK